MDMWVKGYKTHVGVRILKSVSVHIFIRTCIFIQAKRDEYFPYGAFPGMRIFQGRWDLSGLSGLVLNARSDGDTGQHKRKYCSFHHFCLLGAALAPQPEPER